VLKASNFFIRFTFLTKYCSFLSDSRNMNKLRGGSHHAGAAAPLLDNNIPIMDRDMQEKYNAIMKVAKDKGFEARGKKCCFCCLNRFNSPLRQLTQKSLDQWAYLFLELAGDDLVIEKKELQEWFLENRFNIDFRELWDVMAAADTDDDGVEFDEFLVAVTGLKSGRNMFINVITDPIICICLPGIAAPIVGLLDYFFGPFSGWSAIVQNVGYLLAATGVVWIVTRAIYRNIAQNKMIYNQLKMKSKELKTDEKYQSIVVRSKK